MEEKGGFVIRTFVGYARHDSQGEGGLLNRLYVALYLLVNWFLPSQKFLRGNRIGSRVTKVEDNAQTPCARILARKDVPEETKKRLLATSTAVDLTSLYHELCSARNNWMRLPRGDNLW